jgi:hypothetical protein
VRVLVLLAGVLLGFSTTITTAITLAGTALIVGGTGTPNPAAIKDYMQNAVAYYIAPNVTTCPESNCDTVPIKYIAQFWPFPFPGWGGLSGAKWNVSVASGVTGLNSALINQLQSDPSGDVTIFGYSQGAAVASIEKTSLAGLSPALKNQLSFVLIGNPERPNGGIFERLAILGTVPILDATFGLPTPTNTGIATTDIAFQYDGVADFPEYPIDVLADLNAIAGFAYIHGTYLEPNGAAPDGLPDGYTPAELAAEIANPANQVVYGDTTYITIPTPNLPLLTPLRDYLPVLGNPLADLIQPDLKVLVDLGYNPNANPGIPTPFQLIPVINPTTLTTQLVAGAFQGVSNALGDLGGTTLSPLNPAVTTPTITTPSTLAAAMQPLSAATPSTVGSPTVTTADAPKSRTKSQSPTVLTTSSPLALMGASKKTGGGATFGISPAAKTGGSSSTGGGSANPPSKHPGGK